MKPRQRPSLAQRWSSLLDFLFPLRVSLRELRVQNRNFRHLLCRIKSGVVCRDCQHLDAMQQLACRGQNGTLCANCRADLPCIHDLPEHPEGQR